MTQSQSAFALHRNSAFEIHATPVRAPLKSAREYDTIPSLLERGTMPLNGGEVKNGNIKHIREL